MAETRESRSPSPHPMVRDLLAAGEGRTMPIAGYIGPTTEGRVRLYADLGLRTYIEIDKADVVRIVDSTDDPPGPSTVLFRRDASVTYVQTATMKAGDAIAAAMAAPAAPAAGCGCRGEGAASTIARQSGGGPAVDLCTWGCTERLLLCTARSGTLGKLWCYFNYGFCRLGCIDPPIISV